MLLEDELTDLLDRQEMGEVVDTPLLWKIYRLWHRWRISPLELLKWPAWLINAMMVCDSVAIKRAGKNVPPH